MKILEAIQAERLGRVMPKLRRTQVTRGVQQSRIDPISDVYEWLFDVRVGCTLRGPIDAQEHLERQAAAMLARELYGELEGDIRDAIEIVHEEDYRPSDDPLLVKLNGILHKIRGES